MISSMPQLSIEILLGFKMSAGEIKMCLLVQVMSICVGNVVSITAYRNNKDIIKT